MDPLIRDDHATTMQIHTFGCKVNTYDSGLMQKNLLGHGARLVREGAKVHVLNTCAVTAEATKQAVRLARKIKSQSPLSLIVITGCAAQVDTDTFKDLPGVDLVVANSHKGLLPQIIDAHYKGQSTEKVFKSNIFRKEDLEFGGGEEKFHSRSFLKIQDGCNSFCTYCIIPYARGTSRSIPIPSLVQRVRELHQSGFQEVVLTGVHIGDYADADKKLEDLIENILQKTEIPRIRLTSLEPVEVTPRLLDLYSVSPRLCPHFHMSIQSAEDQVLKDMKRQYGAREVTDSLLQIRERIPGAFIGMDVIAGFPTESNDSFESTYRLLSETPWTKLHVFPYSERKGTRAALMDQVPLNLRYERAARLRELSQHRHTTEAAKQIGKIKQVLVQHKKSKGGDGVSHDYWNVRLETGLENGKGIPGGSLQKAQITGVEIQMNGDVVLSGEATP